VISESILEGEKVRLRPMAESDLPRFVEWLQDREVTRWLAAIGEPPTLEDEREWYEDRRADPDNVLWSIETLDGRLLGNMELRLTPRAFRAELGIVIQDKTQWGKGYGEDAIRLALQFAFEDLELNRVDLTTDEDNERGLRCYEKVGFVREGLLRQHRLVDGQPMNSVAMSVLRSEWAAGRRGA
jgi:RimJ/RimL family protein N-acetyltransferase